MEVERQISDNVRGFAMFPGTDIPKGGWLGKFGRRAAYSLICDVLLRSVANPLADVFLFFFPTAVGIVLKNFKISFSVLDFGQRGQG